MKPPTARHSELTNVRETMESIWIAIILAFVLRAFIIEAFVIPTGSMAPRLMGQHQQVRCGACGTEFPVGVHTDGSAPLRQGPTSLHCPNCDEPLTVVDASRGGDRVLVLKYLYDLRQPRRWDVVVFKNPQDNLHNYIKRLAGLPGEVVRIIHGDVFVHPIEDTDGNGVRDENDLPLPVDANARPDLRQVRDWRIARKPYDTQQAMWQILFDNDYRPVPKDNGAAWQSLWQNERGAAGWDLHRNKGRVFRFQSSGERTVRFARGMRDVFLPTNAYNLLSREMPVNAADLCSDLKLQTTVVSEGTKGMVRLTLSHFEHEFAAQFDFDGLVRLLHRTDPKQDWSSSAVWGEYRGEPWRPGRAVRIALTHADWRATVWLDDQPVLASDEQTYQPDVEELVRRTSRDYDVPVPRVAIAAAGGPCELWHTRVWRDVFYTSPTIDEALRGVNGEYARQHRLAEPGQPGWGTSDNPIALRAHGRRAELDEFFMLGDNSPASKDSRLWIEAAPSLRLLDESDQPLYRLGTVPRYNLIGRAFFVYWPAGGKLLPPDQLPFVPNVGKMRRIH